MTRRWLVARGTITWAVIGAAVAIASIPNVNDDAKILVGLASVAFPLCALGAALALERRHDRLAGALLLVSVATPTYFLFALNLPALLVGVALLVSPARTLGDRQSSVSTLA
jgi:hypothetical protein